MKKQIQIYVTDHTGIHGGDVFLWAVLAEEMPNSYKVIKAFNITGDGWNETRSLFILKSYRKTDKRVFHDLDQAKAKAVETAKRIIEYQEEQLETNKTKLEAWS